MAIKRPIKKRNKELILKIEATEIKRNNFTRSSLESRKFEQFIDTKII